VVDAQCSVQWSWGSWGHRFGVRLPGVGAAPPSPGSEPWGDAVSSEVGVWLCKAGTHCVRWRGKKVQNCLLVLPPDARGEWVLVGIC